MCVIRLCVFQEDMAAHVGASRTPQEVMEHYVTMYIHGNLGRACIPESIPNRVTDHTCPGGAPLSPSLTTPALPLELSPGEQQQLGYMPLRDDYEVEYEQEAELLVSGLAVNYDDEEAELELKRAHVDMYVRKLRERQRRKDLARDYSLVPAFLGKERKEKGGQGTPGVSTPPTVGVAAPSNPAKQRKMTKEEREQRVRLRALCQFMAQREFEDFFENVQKERALRARVRELQRYRRNGVTRLDEATEYEAARHKREKRKENKTSKRSGGAIGGGVSLGTGGGANPSPAGAGGATKEDAKDGEFSAIEHLTGFELLSDREKLLCSSLSLSPARYLTVKSIIIKDHLQKRQGAPAKSRLPGYLDKLLKRRILNFLTESGWISRDAT